MFENARFLPWLSITISFFLPIILNQFLNSRLQRGSGLTQGEAKCPIRLGYNRYT